MMRLFVLGLLLCGLMAGCQTTSSFQYLNVPDDDGRVTVDEWGKTTRIKPIREMSYFNFETFQQAGMIENVQMDKNFIYYSVIKKVPMNKTVSLSPGEGEYLTIIERYRVNVDERRKKY
jgi:hypothetical protein